MTFKLKKIAQKFSDKNNYLINWSMKDMMKYLNKAKDLIIMIYLFIQRVKIGQKLLMVVIMHVVLWKR